MIFDKLAGVAERQQLGNQSEVVTRLLEESALFDFPGDARVQIRESNIPGQMGKLLPSFHLPVPVMAIEDSSSLVILGDFVMGAVGPTPERIFVDAIQTALDGESYLSVRVGSLSNLYITDEVGDDGNPLLHGFLKGYAVIQVAAKAGANPIIYPKESKFETDCLVQSGQNALAALEQVMIFNSPDRWVVEDFIPEEKLAKGHRKKKKLLRSHERPRFHLFSAEEIRRALRFPPPEQGGPVFTTRPRGGHFRTYKHERFTNKRGQTQQIAGHWQGPTENLVGSRLYRVRTDLSLPEIPDARIIKGK